MKDTKRALQFVILLGFVSLFSDVTYEAARSLNGTYLAILGASATAVGIVSGLGELIGYSLRLISGYISDKTQRYWLITFIGYTINLLAVPLMALAGYWQIAAAFIIVERLGKAIRTPARDVMLSHAGSQIGSGWVFGLHEAMDQIGATTGPLVVTAILYFKGNYKAAYAVLAIPAMLALISLATARVLYPRPAELSKAFRQVHTQGMRRAFWLYIAAVAFIAAGYADFPLIAFHLKKASVVNENLIPLFYATAMIVDAGAALIVGRLFDKLGLFTIMIGVLFSFLFAPLVFLGNWIFALAGMVLWGIGMGMQESVMRAAIANMVAVEKRGSAYGIFNMGYGFSWFIGSAIMGILYDISVYYVVVFSVVIQGISIFFLYRAKKIESIA
jgi:MFS family permease